MYIAERFLSQIRSGAKGESLLMYPGAMASVAVGGNYERNTDRHGVVRATGNGFVITRRLDTYEEGQHDLHELVQDLGRTTLDIQYNGELDSWHNYYGRKMQAVFSELDSGIVAVRGFRNGDLAYRMYSRGEAAGYIVNTHDAVLHLRRVSETDTAEYVDYPLHREDAILLLTSEGTEIDSGSEDIIRLVYNYHKGEVDQAMLHMMANELTTRSSELVSTRDASVVAIGLRRKPILRVVG